MLQLALTITRLLGTILFLVAIINNDLSILLYSIAIGIYTINDCTTARRSPHATRT